MRPRTNFHLDESKFVPGTYNATSDEQELLDCISLTEPDGKMLRQEVSYRGVHIGFIQIGHGYNESYVIKTNSGKARKIYRSKDECLLALLELLS